MGTGPEQKSRKNGKENGRWPRARNGRKMAIKMEKKGQRANIRPTIPFSVPFFHLIAIFRPFRARGHLPFSFPFFRDFCSGPVSHSVNGHFNRKAGRLTRCIANKVESQDSATLDKNRLPVAKCRGCSCFIPWSLRHSFFKRHVCPRAFFPQGSRRLRWAERHQPAHAAVASYGSELSLLRTTWSSPKCVGLREVPNSERYRSILNYYPIDSKTILWGNSEMTPQRN